MNLVVVALLGLSAEGYVGASSNAARLPDGEAAAVAGVGLYANGQWVQRRLHAGLGADLRTAIDDLEVRETYVTATGGYRQPFGGFELGLDLGTLYSDGLTAWDQNGVLPSPELRSVLSLRLRPFVALALGPQTRLEASGRFGNASISGAEDYSHSEFGGELHLRHSLSDALWLGLHAGGGARPFDGLVARRRTGEVVEDEEVLLTLVESGLTLQGEVSAFSYQLGFDFVRVFDRVDGWFGHQALALTAEAGWWPQKGPSLNGGVGCRQRDFVAREGEDPTLVETEFDLRLELGWRLASVTPFIRLAHMSGFTEPEGDIFDETLVLAGLRVEP